MDSFADGKPDIEILDTQQGFSHCSSGIYFSVISVLVKVDEKIVLGALMAGPGKFRILWSVRA